jgi:hypothetical protein
MNFPHKYEHPNTLETVSARVGRANAMLLSLHIAGSPKVDVWEAEAEVWQRRRQQLVTNSPFPGQSALEAETISCEAYTAALPDTSAFKYTRV